jgi:hypothetical protein
MQRVPNRLPIRADPITLAEHEYRHIYENMMQVIEPGLYSNAQASSFGAEPRRIFARAKQRPDAVASPSGSRAEQVNDRSCILNAFGRPQNVHYFASRPPLPQAGIQLLKLVL